MSVKENVSLSPQPSPEADMYMYLYASGAASLGLVQWYVNKLLHIGLVLHTSKSCKSYAASTVEYQGQTRSLLQVHTSGEKYTVCTLCGQDSIGGADARQEGYALHIGVRNVTEAKKIRETFYKDYPALGESVIFIMARQDIHTISRKAKAPLLAASRAHTLAMLKSSLSELSGDVREFNHELVCLSVREALRTRTRTDSSVRVLCDVSDEETVHGLRIAWARGLSDSFIKWQEMVTESRHVCPNVSEYVLSYSDAFLKDLGISRDVMFKAVSSWTREYWRLRAMSGLEYVGIYGTSDHHYSAPRSMADIGVHAALLHPPVGSFAFGVMPKIAALYLKESRSRNSRSPSVLPLDIPYDRDLLAGSDVLDTALALFRSDNGIFRNDAAKSLQAAMCL